MRCKSCGNDWRATAEDVPLELGEGVVAAVAPALSPVAPINEDTLVEEETAAPALTQTFRTRAAQKRRTQKAIRQGLGWAVTIILLLAALAASYIWRDSIVAKVPKLGSVYKLVGIQTNPVGLDFEVIKTGFANNDIGQIYVAGALRNIRDHEIVIPPIRVALIDRSGREYDHHILRLQEPPVLPGAVQGFAVVLPNKDGRFAETTLSLLWQDTASTPAAPPQKAAAPKAHQGAEPVPAQAGTPAVAPKAAEPAAPAPAATPAATPAAPGKAASSQTAPAKTAEPKPATAPASTATPASSDGLRRISQLITSSPSERTNLDTGRLEGVSAKHG